MNLSMLEESLTKTIQTEISDMIEREIRKVGEEVILREINRALMRVHTTMTRIENGPTVEMRFLVDFRKDKP